MHSEHILPHTLTRLHHVRDQQTYMREAHTTAWHTIWWNTSHATPNQTLKRFQFQDSGLIPFGNNCSMCLCMHMTEQHSSIPL